ncbi:MAG: hypothetical protein GX444_08155 [Myxococcales bacterium]|nr:hypothetical protein [Myxococcales bacterium]
MSPRGWLLICAIFLLLSLAACDDDDPSTDPGQADDDNDDTSPLDDDDDDNDDNDNDDDNDDNDDDDTPAPLLYFVQPDLPLNAYHLAASHNTFIWKGLQGVLTVVASMGVLDALQKQQVFIELDVNETTADGDFLISHSETTNRVRLSSVFRNVRWWSDIHPGHPPINLGFEWNVGTGEAETAALRALIEEFFVEPSPLTAAGPLLDLAAWTDERVTALDEATQGAIRALSPADLARVLGYPTVRELQGKVVFEVGDSLAATQPYFFLMAGDGQISNNSQDSLDDLELIAGVRAAQRLTRVYTTTVVFGGNYDIFRAMTNGVSNAALNHQRTTGDDPEVYAFADEYFPGFAPDATLAAVDPVPARLGPPVFVSAVAAAEGTDLWLYVPYDPALGLPDAPVAVANVAVRGLGGGTVSGVAPDAATTVLVDREDESRFLVVAVDPATVQSTIFLHLDGDPFGYEILVSGPTVNAPAVNKSAAGGKGGTLWASPKFELVDLTPTGRCASLGPGGERRYGAWDGLACDAGENPSFLIEAAY